MHIRYLTAGESHGKALVAIIDGVPKGIALDTAFINKELKRRMSGFGRGKRMSIEKDKIEVLSGTRKGTTLGSPIALLVKNRDHKIESLHSIFSPRPGHADLAGAMKFGTHDMRDILERSSARETASRVAIGAVMKLILRVFGIEVLSHVRQIGGITAGSCHPFGKIRTLSERSPVRCADSSASRRMILEIKRAQKDKDTLGGIFEVIARGVVPGLGSYTQWDRRLDADLAKAVMSIPGVKGVEIGNGFRVAGERGSCVHDEISFDKKQKRFTRKTNRAGGIEGGISNGEDIIIGAVMKPIATLLDPLESVNIRTKKKAKAQVERADVCVVPAAGVIAESAVALEIARSLTQKFGGDTIAEMKRNYEGYLSALKKL